MKACTRGGAASRQSRIRLLAAAAAAFVLLCAPVARAGKVAPISADALNSVLFDNSGRRVVVFMAAWCAPCVEELPTLNRLYAVFAPRGLEVVGVALDPGGPEAMQPIIDRLQIRFPVYWAGDTAALTYRISRIPLMLLIQDGEEVKRIVGGRSPEAIESAFRKFME